MRPEYPKNPELWHAVVGKSGRMWLIPVDVPNKADHIHVTNSSDYQKAGEGYGGATLKFSIDDGTTFELRGGWHSNSNSLLADTGVDLRDLCYTHIDVLVEYVNGKKKEVEYDTEGWSLDTFEREEDMEWLRNDILEIPIVKAIHITKYSLGGSTSFWMKK